MYRQSNDTSFLFVYILRCDVLENLSPTMCNYMEASTKRVRITLGGIYIELTNMKGNLTVTDPER